MPADQVRGLKAHRTTSATGAACRAVVHANSAVRPSIRLPQTNTLPLRGLAAKPPLTLSLSPQAGRGTPAAATSPEPAPESGRVDVPFSLPPPAGRGPG